MLGVAAGVMRHSVAWGVVTAVFALLAIVSMRQGWMDTAGTRTIMLVSSASQGAMAIIKGLFSGRKSHVGIHMHDVFLGFDETMGRPLFVNLAELGHIFVAGQSRFGKTVLIWGILVELLRNHMPDELMIAIADDKSSFKILSAIPHLVAPIALGVTETGMLIRAIYDEMRERKRKFDTYADTRICNSLDKYADLSGERLPHLLVILDETADIVARGSEAEGLLKSLAKQGLEYGITLLMATQRPTASGMSHEVQSQCSTFFSTYMKNSLEYGSVSRIPKQVSKEMTPTRGRFMLYTPELAGVFWNEFPGKEGWGFVRTQLHKDRDLERLARQLSQGRQPKVWEQAPAQRQSTAVPVRTWAGLGPAENKFKAIADLHKEIGRIPTAVELRERYEMSRKTSETWMQRYQRRTDSA